MISLVIPAFNEQDQIATTIATASGVLRSAKLEPFEIVVVDDGSTDATGAQARKAGARVVTHIQNLGYGRSLKDGIAASSYDTIVITDADGTYPLGEIPTLVAEYDRGFDMVVGARTGRHYRESFIKSPMRKLLKWLVEFTAGRSIPDTNSGLRVFSRKTIMPYYNHLCDTFSFTTAATLAYMMTGRTVAYLPIPYHQRVGKSKVRLLRDSMRTLQYIVEAIIYYNPLKIFIVCSAFCVALGLICIPFAIVFRITTLFMFSAGTMLVAILIFSLGLLAVLLRQIMDVGRPTLAADSAQVIATEAPRAGRIASDPPPARRVS
jgi:glycosyltransferase involved in cell wall biosynthesis